VSALSINSAYECSCWTPVGSNLTEMMRCGGWPNTSLNSLQ